MTQPFGLDEIRAFWRNQAVEFGDSHAASWSDRYVMEMEIREILRRLDDADRVPDVGCASGWSTLSFASQKRLDLVGVDYIPAMVEQARRRLATLKNQLVGTVSFDVGDITSLAKLAASFDKLIVIRVVINLGDWARQCLALRECARVLRPGGVLLVSEATMQGWKRMNGFRAEWGLPPIPKPMIPVFVQSRCNYFQRGSLFLCVSVPTPLS
jgi:ubiquinone/menaquinone biosynthesis C-methylase UbiE